MEEAEEDNDDERVYIFFPPTLSCSKMFSFFSILISFPCTPMLCLSLFSFMPWERKELLLVATIRWHEKWDDDDDCHRWKVVNFPCWSK